MQPPTSTCKKFGKRWCGLLHPPPLVSRRNPMGSPAIRELGTHGARPEFMVEARGDQEDVKDANGMVKRPVAAPPRPPWDYAGELGPAGDGRGH